MRAVRAFGWYVTLLTGCLGGAPSPAPTPSQGGTETGTEPMPSPGPIPNPPSTPPATPPATPPPAPIRIAAGATADYKDSAGQLWTADTGFVGGVGFVNPNPVAISGTIAPQLYNGERYGVDANQKPAGFSYAVAVPNGGYTVNLGFAETFVQAAGQRAFNIAINGNPVASAFDIYAAAGGMNRAVVKSFAVTVADGQLRLAFDPGTVQSPKVDTIEIVSK